MFFALYFFIFFGISHNPTLYTIGRIIKGEHDSLTTHKPCSTTLHTSVELISPYKLSSNLKLSNQNSLSNSPYKLKIIATFNYAPKCRTTMSISAIFLSFLRDIIMVTV